MAKFLSKTVGKTDCYNTCLLALSTLGDTIQNMISILCTIAQDTQGKWAWTAASGWGESFCKITFPNEKLKFKNSKIS